MGKASIQRRDAESRRKTRRKPRTRESRCEEFTRCRGWRAEEAERAEITAGRKDTIATLKWGWSGTATGGARAGAGWGGGGGEGRSGTGGGKKKKKIKFKIWR